MGTTTPIEIDPIAIDYGQLLADWNRGDERARARLFDHVYRELHRMARGRMAAERAGHTLAPTALVHEVFVRLGAASIRAEDKRQFLSLCAGVMRSILVDGARRREAGRRALQNRQDAACAPQDLRILRLDDALQRLARCDRQLFEVAELRFLVGLDVEATAAALGISTATVKRHWRTARAFLQREIERDG